jgi:hypothetical protein
MKKKKPNFFKIILIAISIVCFWRGAWGLMDLYIFPDHEAVSYFVSIIIGIVILYVTRQLADSLI